MGANIARDVALGITTNDPKYTCEGTLGYVDDHSKDVLFKLLDYDTYRVTCIKDVQGIEVLGCLKNIIALGCGLVQGMGGSGNTKVSILRNGLLEMLRFLKYFYPSSDTLIFESCGIADLIVSCQEGRNYKYGIEKEKNGMEVEEFEKSIENQKIQGVGTSINIYNFLLSKERTKDFPLFVAIYKIFNEDEESKILLECIGNK